MEDSSYPLLVVRDEQAVVTSLSYPLDAAICRAVTSWIRTSSSSSFSSQDLHTHTEREIERERGYNSVISCHTKQYNVALTTSHMCMYVCVYDD